MVLPIKSYLNRRILNARQYGKVQAATSESLTLQARPMVGCYMWDIPYGPQRFPYFENWLERSIDLGMSFGDPNSWANLGDPSWQTGAWGAWVNEAEGRNLMHGTPLVAPGGTLLEVADGTRDSVWQSLADVLMADGLGNALLRVGWEMDGGWYAWHAEDWGPDKTNFKNAFIRVVDVMRARQPTNNWKFVLNPTTNSWNTTYLNDIYPGDTKVDYIALDIYDQSWAADTYPYPGGASKEVREQRQLNAWNSQTFYLNQISSFAAAHGKQTGICEWGIATRGFDDNGGKDAPSFIQRMYDWIHDPVNNCAFHGYFNVSASDIDARLTYAQVPGDSPSVETRHPESAELFRKLFNGRELLAHYVTISSGTGAGQTRVISNYNSHTRLLQVDPVWTTTPDTTSIYRIS